MFENQYIIEILSGKLSYTGYRSIVETVAGMARLHQWPVNICTGYQGETWTAEMAKELTHAFFEWMIVKDKLKYLYKIPESYLGYYFTQMLVSFVADRIKCIQEETGLSYRKCAELVKGVCKRDYETLLVEGKEYVSANGQNVERCAYDKEKILEYLPKYHVGNEAGKLKASVSMAVEDVLNMVGGAVAVDDMCDMVFDMIVYVEDDNRHEPVPPASDTIVDSDYHGIVRMALNGVDSTLAKMILDYLFQQNGVMSLTDMENKYHVPKSTIHYKMEKARNKIAQAYVPDNEQDGINYLKNIAERLDEIANSKY